MNRFFLFILILLSAPSYGQDEVYENLIEKLESDSLNREEKGQEVQNAIKSIHMQPEVKLQRLNVILGMIQKYNEPEYYWNWHIGYVAYLKESGDADAASAHAYLLLAEAERRNNTLWIADAYAELYIIFFNAGMHDKGLGYLNNSFEGYLQADDLSGITQTSYLLGYSYYVLGKNDSAIFHLENAEKYRVSSKAQEFVGEYTYLAARTHIRNKNYSEGLKLLRYVRDNAHRIETDNYKHHYHAGANMYMAQVHILLDDLDSANYYFDLCAAEYRSYNPEELTYAHLYQGITYTSKGYFKEALAHYDYLIDSTDFDLPLDMVGKAYIGTGQLEKGAEYYALALQKQDSTNKAAIENMTNLLEESASAELDLQKEKDEEKRMAAEKIAESEKQQKFLILGGVFVIGVIIFIFGRILVKRYKIIKEQKEEIDQQKMQVEEKNQEILDSINYAKRIQDAILPSESTFQKLLPQSFVLYKPKDVVAGDFYWLEQIGDKVVFAAADCTGHGVPGAMVSVVCHNALNRAVREFKLSSPGPILDKTRELVVEAFSKNESQIKDGMDIALCTLDLNTRILEFAGANNSIYIIRGGEIIETKADKQPIGIYENAQAFTTHQIEIKEKDQVFVFTDGFADQFGGDKGKKFKYKNFRDHLVKYQNEKPSIQRLKLDTAFEKWRGDLEQVDDVCVIGVKF